MINFLLFSSETYFLSCLISTLFSEASTKYHSRATRSWFMNTHVPDAPKSISVKPNQPYIIERFNMLGPRRIAPSGNTLNSVMVGGTSKAFSAWWTRNQSTTENYRLRQYETMSKSIDGRTIGRLLLSRNPLLSKIESRPSITESRQPRTSACFDVRSTNWGSYSVNWRQMKIWTKKLTVFL